VTQLVDDQDPPVRLTALSVLGKLGPEARAAVLGLAERLRAAREWDDQRPLLKALGEIGPEARTAAPAVAAVALQVKDNLDKTLAAKKAEELKDWRLTRETIVVKGKVVSKTDYWRATVGGADGRPTKELKDYGKDHPALRFESRIFELRNQQDVVNEVLKRIEGP
jgi:hypothetical protein